MTREACTHIFFNKGNYQCTQTLLYTNALFMHTSEIAYPSMSLDELDTI